MQLDYKLPPYLRKFNELGMKTKLLQSHIETLNEYLIGRCFGYSPEELSPIKQIIGAAKYRTAKLDPEDKSVRSTESMKKNHNHPGTGLWGLFEDFHAPMMFVVRNMFSDMERRGFTLKRADGTTFRLAELRLDPVTGGELVAHDEITNEDGQRIAKGEVITLRKYHPPPPQPDKNPFSITNREGKEIDSETFYWLTWVVSTSFGARLRGDNAVAAIKRYGPDMAMSLKEKTADLFCEGLPRYGYNAGPLFDKFMQYSKKSIERRLPDLRSALKVLEDISPEKAAAVTKELDDCLSVYGLSLGKSQSTGVG